MIDCEDYDEDIPSVFDEVVTYTYDPSTETEIVNTTFEMRGLVNNYSNPVCSVFAKLYESLLVKIYRNINIDILDDLRIDLSKDDDIAFENGYFERAKRKEKVDNDCKDEPLSIKFERMLLDIKNKSNENTVIYNDLFEITKINVNYLADFCSAMADIDLKYIHNEIDFVERKDLQKEIVNKFESKAKEELNTYGITLKDFPYFDACEYLKYVY